MAPRVLMLSWEYPPLVEGGLGRHVRKLAEGLVALPARPSVHVLTRGREGDVPQEVCAGVRVHRVGEPRRPTDLDAFVTWVEAMNRDMLDAGRALAQRTRFHVVHGHDWLVASAAARLAHELELPYVTRVHATEHGRHHGWVDRHPQSHVHGVESWMARRADRVVVCCRTCATTSPTSSARPTRACA